MGAGGGHSFGVYCMQHVCCEVMMDDAVERVYGLARYERVASVTFRRSIEDTIDFVTAVCSIEEKLGVKSSQAGAATHKRGSLYCYPPPLLLCVFFKTSCVVRGACGARFAQQSLRG